MEKTRLLGEIGELVEEDFSSENHRHLLPGFRLLHHLHPSLHMDPHQGMTILRLG
jgi:NifB/MoaA-like Fe-S oxidoreductase